MEAVENIHNTFNAEMQFAAQAGKEDRKALVDRAVNNDIKWMKYILDEKQYRKYLLLLNTTLNNRGLNKWEYVLIGICNADVAAGEILQPLFCLP